MSQWIARATNRYARTSSTSVFISRRRYHETAPISVPQHSLKKTRKLETSELGLRSRLPPDSNSKPDPKSHPKFPTRIGRYGPSLRSFRTRYLCITTHAPGFFQYWSYNVNRQSHWHPTAVHLDPTANANPLDYHTFNDDIESIYSPKVRLSYTPPVALPAPFPKILRVEGLPLYMTSAVFIRHTMNALYSNLDVALQKVVVKTPSSSHPSSSIDSNDSDATRHEPEVQKVKFGKRLSRDKSILIELCVTGTARVSGSPGEWEVNSTYTFSPATGLIYMHTINSIYPAPHQAVYDALRLSLGKVFGLAERGEGARTNGATCRAAGDGKAPEH